MIFDLLTRVLGLVTGVLGLFLFLFNDTGQLAWAVGAAVLMGAGYWLFTREPSPRE